jgi:hypothetical protein
MAPADADRHARVRSYDRNNQPTQKQTSEMTTNNSDGDSDPRSKMPIGLEHFDTVTDLEYLRKGIYIHLPR